MKNLLSIASVCLFCIVLASQMAYSQDEMQAKKHDNPDWKNVVVIDYKPGMYGKAMDIIENYYRKAGEKAGTPMPQRIKLETGEWDILLIWDMKDGIESMNWDVSPDNIAWRKALNEIAGSSEKADEINKEYQSTIARSKNSIGMLLK